MVQHKQSYDIIIEDTIARSQEKGGQCLTEIHRSLSKQYHTVSRRTTFRHLVKMRDKEIITKEKPLAHNKQNYLLTPARIFEWQRFGIGATEVGSEEDKKRNDREACIRTLFSAASGTDLPIIVNKPVVGAVAIYNQTTRKYEYLKSEKVEGVSHQDIVSHNDMMSLFRGVDFTKSKNYVEILQEFGLRDAIEPTTRLGENGEIIRGIKIADSHMWLKEFLVQCECMLSWVRLRVEQTLKIRLMDVMYKDGSLVELSSIPLDYFGTFERKAFRLYMDIEGRKAFNSLYDDCRKLLAEKISDIDSSNELSSRSGNRRKREQIHKFIQEDRTKRKSWIKQWDKTIIAYYHVLYKCDKLVPDSPWGPGVDGQRKYKEYRHYVKDVMPKEEHQNLMYCLLEILYPRFLQELHENDPELRQFVESLPDADSDTLVV